MPRKRSNIKSHLKHVPKEYIDKKETIAIVSIIINIITSIIAVIAMVLLSINQ